MSVKGRTAIIIGAAVIVVIVALVAGRGWISSNSYYRGAGRLSSSMPVGLQAKYGEELKYTVDKFWSCYEEGICSRNDMTDVMDSIPTGWMIITGKAFARWKRRISRISRTGRVSTSSRARRRGNS